MLQSHVLFSNEDNPGSGSGNWAVPGGHDENSETCDPSHMAEQMFHFCHAFVPGGGPASTAGPHVSYVEHIRHAGTGFRAHSLPAGWVPMLTVVLGNAVREPFTKAIQEVLPAKRSGVRWKHSSETLPSFRHSLYEYPPPWFALMAHATSTSVPRAQTWLETFGSIRPSAP